MTAYSGMYRLEANKFIVNVDVSWNPSYLGAEQVRFFKIDGDQLQVTNEWHPAVVKPERGMGRSFFYLPTSEVEDRIFPVFVTLL